MTMETEPLELQRVNALTLLNAIPTQPTNSKNSTDSQPKQQELTGDDATWAEIHKILKTQNHHLPKKWESMDFTGLDLQNYNAESAENIIGLWNWVYYESLETAVGFLISGNTGAGKTHILAATMRLIAWRWFHLNSRKINEQVQFWTFLDLCAYLREDPLDRKRMFKLKNAKFLFIDDLGTSRSTDFMQEKVFEIIDHRCSEELPTFITTNLSPDQLKNEYTERMTSRLKESFIVLDLKTVKDFRNTKYLENKKRFEQYKKGLNENTVQT